MYPLPESGCSVAPSPKQSLVLPQSDSPNPPSLSCSLSWQPRLSRMPQTRNPRIYN